MGIARKLWIGVIFLIIANVFIVGFSGVRTASLKARSEAASEVLDRKIEAAQRWSWHAVQATQQTVTAAYSSDVATQASWRALQADHAQRAEAARAELAQLPLSEADRARLQQVDEAHAALTALLAQAQPGGAIPENVTAALKQHGDAVLALTVQQPQNAIDLRHEIAEERSKTVVLAGVMGVVVLSTMAVCAGLLIRSIREPLREAMDAAARMAAGDLTVSIQPRGRDELGQLLGSLKILSDSLHRVVGHVRETTNHFQTASSEIAEGSQDLSSRTEQTSANLQQTASSMTHLTDTVQHSASAAQEAHALVGQASETARRGGDVMGQVVANMEGIAQASRKINDIIGVIDGIAFQTNILALNAAVEAARAGEQGRGFAVVAGEVRALAGRSAEAAREIKHLIGASVEQVESGARLVQDAGSTMEEIVAAVSRVTGVIDEISAATLEQSEGIGQINQAVGQLDQMTQQNAALVEQSAAAAASLNEQARQLAEAVEVFRV